MMCMSWLRLHPYAAASAVVGLLLAVGALIVESRSSVEPGALSVWGGAGAPLFNPLSYAPQRADIGVPAQGEEDAGPPIYIPPSHLTDTEGTAANEQFDLDTFLASLVQPSSAVGTATSSDVAYAYSFIPQGLISVDVSVSRTPEQQLLYAYGNDAGSYIQTYEDTNRGAPTALRDQAEDRQNPQKAQAVRLVAAAMRTAGESLRGMESVPASVRTVHDALAASYIEAGARLAKVTDATGDDAFIAAITAYNEAADVLVGHYVSLATHFALSGVKFLPGDPGSIFTFTAGGGL